MSAAIPQGALVAFVLVLIYSFLCLAATLLLVYMLFANGEKTNYVTLIALVTCVSSTASIIQQIYYACQCRNIKITALQQAKESRDTPTIAYGPLSTGFDLAMFEIQFCCYTICSVLILFWAMALARGVYNLRYKWLLGREDVIATASKVFALIVPVVLIGITFTDPVRHSVVANLAITNIVLLGSLVMGSIIVIAVLVRYVYSRHMFSSMQGSNSMSTANSNARPGPPQGAKIKVDKVLLLRFTIAFVILSAFEVTLISFEFSRKVNARRLATQQQPDFSVAGAVNDILQFMPGVTAGLLAFLLFGTTAQFRKTYAKAFRSMRWRRSRRPPSVRPAGGIGIWDSLDSGRLVPAYRCTIRAGDVDTIEMQSSDISGKSRSAVREEERLPARPILSQPSSPPVTQPWRTLGIP
ncbi:hypothetical protein LTR85_001171 [Meristemomyces frigidus]|nr:hypothetical protein LTR85_001171 [Meristemomyces frigidus]